MTTPEIRRTLVTSTSHITKNDMGTLKELSTNAVLKPIILSYTYGVLFRYIDTEIISELVNEHGVDGKSPIIALLEYALTQGCMSLELDADAPCIDGFETYSW